MQRLSEGYTKSNFPNLVIDCIYIQKEVIVHQKYSP